MVMCQKKKKKKTSERLTSSSKEAQLKSEDRPVVCDFYVANEAENYCGETRFQLIKHRVTAK